MCDIGVAPLERSGPTGAPHDARTRGTAESTNRAARVAEQLRRQLSPDEASVAVVSDELIEVASPSADSDRSLEVRVRGAADLEVAFLVPSRQGSPFEQCFIGPAEEADAVIREVVAFACDLIAERVVLAWHSGLLRGGRRFLEASDLSDAAKRRYAWVVSWRGTRDWPPDERPRGEPEGRPGPAGDRPGYPSSSRASSVTRPAVKPKCSPRSE